MNIKEYREIIKNKKVEIANLKLDSETLDSKLHYANELLDESNETINKLKQDAKDKEIFRKGFSVLLASVNEKSLAWSLSEAYDRQKEVHTNKVQTETTNKDLISNLFNSTKVLDNLDSLIDDVLGSKKGKTKK